MYGFRSVLFVQKRTHRAGAQTCLARLLCHEAIRRWNPIVLCSPGGWLVEECRRIGIPVIEEVFPSSRSLAGWLGGNTRFARRVMARLSESGFRPTIVQANDHQEGLLGLALAKRLQASTAMFLRSSAMSRRDFFKYRCDRYDFLSAVGDDFLSRVQLWTPQRRIDLIRDGVLAEEICAPKPPATKPPTRVLVVGSPLAGKGWADLTDALCALEQQGRLPSMRFDFMGVQPNPAKNALRLERLQSAICMFLGQVETPRDLISKYDLVINPSRTESFGMAAIEVLAAGVPLISSRTGVIAQVLKSEEMLFEPNSPVSLAKALDNLLANWSRVDFGVRAAQARIRESFLIDHAACQMNAIYANLIGQQSRAR